MRRLRETLSDDLDTPAALAAVDRWAGADGGSAAAAQDVARAVDALPGVV